MADTYEIRHAVSVSPVEQLEDQQGNTHDHIAGEVGKTLGGDGETSVTDYQGTASSLGFQNAAANYLEAPDGAGGEVAVSDETAAAFVFIKNTGHVFSTAAALGTEEANSRRIKVTASAGAITLASLGHGEAYIMPAQTGTGAVDATGIKVETVDSDGNESAGGSHLAVEYMIGR